MIGTLRHPRLVRVFRRSRLKRELVFALLGRESVYLAQAARAIGSDVRRVRWLLFGHMPQYVPGDGLVPLGLARVSLDARGRPLVELTPRGRVVARAMRRRIHTKRGT